MAYKRRDKKANEKGLSKSSQTQFQRGFNAGYAKGRRGLELEMAKSFFDTVIKGATIQAEVAKQGLSIVEKGITAVPAEQSLEAFTALLGFVERTTQNFESEETKRLDMTFEFLDSQIERAIPLCQSYFNYKEAKVRAEQVDSLARQVEARAKVQAMKAEASADSTKAG